MLTLMNYRGLALVAGLAWLTGCAATEQPASSGANESRTAEQTRWPFWPTAMRLHPLSRLVTGAGEDAETVIEARLELLDREGHTTKGFGQVAIDLLDASRPGSPPTLHWEQDLRDLALNAQYFDDVTRTYLFKLDTLNEIPDRPRLAVLFVSADGTRLEAERELRR